MPMNTSDNADLNLELKRLIVEAADKDIDPAEIGDDEPLFGRRSTLGLDSLDALQISMSLQSRYGIVITDPKQLRRLLISVNTLADYLQDARSNP